MKLSIVVPAYNEQENIASVIHKIESCLDFEHELIVVNDHSSDETPRLVKELTKQYIHLRLIDNPRERGFANAIKTGFTNANGQVLLPVMGDLCDDLLIVKKMLEKINSGYDVVCGARYIKGGMRMGGSRIKGFLSGFAGWSLYYLLAIPTHDIANAFKMYRKTVLESIDIKSLGFEISMEIPLKAYYRGFKITEVPTVWREREKGKSSFKMFKLIPSYAKLYLWAISKRLLR